MLLGLVHGWFLRNLFFYEEKSGVTFRSPELQLGQQKQTVDLSVLLLK